VATFPNLSIASGNVLCRNATVAYAGGAVGTITNGVNYVYFDCFTSVPKSSTSPFTGGQIPLAVVVAQSSSYGTSGLLDVRAWAVTRSGTTTPSYLLDVAGGSARVANSSGTTQVVISGSATWGRFGQDSAGVFLTSETSGGALRFATNNGTLNEWMRITSAGNVGIGTTTPALQLQVNKAMAPGIVSQKCSVVGSSPTFDLSAGNTQQYACDCSAGPNITLTFINLTRGEPMTFILVQNGTTACNLTSWPSNIHGAMPPSFLSALGSINAQRFVVSSNGTDLYATGPGSVSMTGGTP
jgi:hypothetical protein